MTSTHIFEEDREKTEKDTNKYVVSDTQERIITIPIRVEVPLNKITLSYFSLDASLSSLVQDLGTSFCQIKDRQEWKIRTVLNRRHPKASLI